MFHLNRRTQLKKSQYFIIFKIKFSNFSMVSKILFVGWFRTAEIERDWEAAMVRDVFFTTLLNMDRWVTNHSSVLTINWPITTQHFLLFPGNLSWVWRLQLIVWQIKTLNLWPLKISFTLHTNWSHLIKLGWIKN